VYCGNELVRSPYSKMIVPNIEVSSSAKIADMVTRHGFAIWRGLYLPPLISAVMNKVVSNIQRPEAYASLKHGTMDPNILGPRLKNELLTREVGAAFQSMLGNAEYTISDAESPIFVSGHGKKPTVWHQDKCVNKIPSALVWVALTSCGISSPSMSIALHGISEVHPVFLADDIRRSAEKDRLMEQSGWPVMTLIFNPGDAVFFNSYSIHKTYITSEMTHQRVSVKLTAVPN